MAGLPVDPGRRLGALAAQRSGRSMPYEVAFTKAVAIADREQYINECCVAGDLVVEALRADVERHYEVVDAGQEDWGWFLWVRKGPLKLAIDVFTDDADAGAFRIRLTSRVRRMFVFERAQDTPELDELRTLVCDGLARWNAADISIEAVPDGREA